MIDQLAHRWGCQVPNGPEWSAQDIADIYGSGVFVLMQGELGELPKLRELLPNAIFVWRAWLQDWSQTDPRWWARECAVVYRQIKHLTRFIKWANEQNLRAESGGKIGADESHRATESDYILIREWNLAWLDEFTKQPGCDDAILVFPSLAYGHSDDQDDGEGFIGLDILKPVIERCDIGSIHLYVKKGKPILDEWEGLGRLAIQRPWFLGKPLLIAETGCFEAGSPGYAAKLVAIGYELQRHDDIIGFCYFIHADPTKHHQENDMSRDPQPYGAIREATKTPRPDWTAIGPSEPPPDTPEEPSEEPPVTDPSNVVIKLEAGRGLWSWYKANNGGIGGLIEKAQISKSRHILLKCADADHGFDGVTRSDVSSLQNAGLSVLLWHYIYGVVPSGEIAIAVQRIRELRPSGWVADVEAEYASSDAPAITGYRYAHTIKAICEEQGIPFGYSPVPVIDFHQRLPWVQFNEVCDFVMPQFYRRMLGYPPWSFEALWEQWERWTRTWTDAGLRVPPQILPIGEAYLDNQTGVLIPDSDIAEYETFCESIKCDVPTYWVADFAQQSHLEAMGALGGVDVADPQVPEEQKIRDEAWKLCDQLEALAVRARNIGMPWRGHGLDGASLAGKAATKVNE